MVLDHKEVYQAVLIEPMKELVQARPPVMMEIDGQLTTEPRVDKTISRLRRDTRYSTTSPYTGIPCGLFSKGKMHGTEVPGIYFEITCDGFNYGCGFYHASSGYMNTMRKLILQGDPALEKAQAAYLSQKLFQIEGEQYKRPPLPSAAGRKPDCGWREGDSALLRRATTSSCFFLTGFHISWKSFRRLAPIYRFLLHTSQVERGKPIRTVGTF